jgi:transcriptional/translational regulatory protein YebC/TACO1
VPLLNWKDIVTLKEGGQITKLIQIESRCSNSKATNMPKENVERAIKTNK